MPEGLIQLSNLTKTPELHTELIPLLLLLLLRLRRLRRRQQQGQPAPIGAQHGGRGGTGARGFLPPQAYRGVGREGSEQHEQSR
jgi:hypothetical protein